MLVTRNVLYMPTTLRHDTASSLVVNGSDKISELTVLGVSTSGNIWCCLPPPVCVIVLWFIPDTRPSGDICKPKVARKFARAGEANKNRRFSSQVDLRNFSKVSQVDPSGLKDFWIWARFFTFFTESRIFARF